MVKNIDNKLSEIQAQKFKIDRPKLKSKIESGEYCVDVIDTLIDRSLRIAYSGIRVDEWSSEDRVRAAYKIYLTLTLTSDDHCNEISIEDKRSFK